MYRLKTYLVEDSPVIRENLIAALEELAPVTVTGWADNEATALSWMATHDRQADLVIVDIFLKQGSGLGVLGSAQAQSNGGKVVVLTNYATPDIRRKCLELGADRVFDKSNEIDALFLYCQQMARGKSGQSDAAPSP
jgi:DNA-binding NarL/FixJ family response regulator